jgi:hypothetical protein
MHIHVLHVYPYICVGVCVHICIYTLTCIYRWMHAATLLHSHAARRQRTKRIFSYTHIHRNVNICMYVCIYIHIYMQVDACSDSFATLTQLITSVQKAQQASINCNTNTSNATASGPRTNHNNNNNNNNHNNNSKHDRFDEDDDSDHDDIMTIPSSAAAAARRQRNRDEGVALFDSERGNYMSPNRNSGGGQPLSGGRHAPRTGMMNHDHHSHDEYNRNSQDMKRNSKKAYSSASSDDDFIFATRDRCSPSAKKAREYAASAGQHFSAGRRFADDAEWEDVGPAGGGLNTDFDYSAGINKLRGAGPMRGAGSSVHVHADFFSPQRIKESRKRDRKILEGCGRGDWEVRVEECGVACAIYGGNDWCSKPSVPRSRRKKQGQNAHVMMGVDVMLADCGDVVAVCSAAEVCILCACVHVFIYVCM